MTKKNVLLAGAMALLASAPTFAQHWGNVQAGHDARGYATARLEGGGTMTNKGLGKRLGYYFFVDADGQKGRPLDMRTWYGEGRLLFGLGKGVSTLYEHNDGTGLTHAERFGIAWNAPVNDFTQIRATHGNAGSQVGLYTSRIVGPVTADALLEYNGHGRTYSELGLQLKIGKAGSLFTRTRNFGKLKSAGSLDNLTFGWRKDWK